MPTTTTARTATTTRTRRTRLATKPASAEGTTRSYDYFSAVLAYEDGTLSDASTIELFQHLLNTGLVWGFQGHYQRVANQLIAEGYISRPE